MQEMREGVAKYIETLNTSDVKRFKCAVVENSYGLSECVLALIMLLIMTFKRLKNDHETKTGNKYQL